jgi:methyl-accepting chemotaxis protein
MKMLYPKVLAIALLVVLVAPIAFAQALTVSTDKRTYIPGETVVVSGSAPAGSWIGISIVNPAGKEVDFKMVQADATGRYSTSVKLPSKLPYADWIAGEYTVTAYLGSSTAKTTFVLSAGARALGKVVDVKGNPLADAEIVVVETGDYAKSKADGSFELYTSPGTVTVRVSKAGYTKFEKSYTLTIGDNDLGTITLQSLEDVIAALNARVVELETKIATVDKTLTDIQKTLTDIATAIGKLATKDDVTNARNSIIDALKPISTDLAAVKGDVAAIKASLADVKSSVDRVATDLGAVKTDLGTVKGDVAAIKSGVADLSGAVKAVSDAVTAARGDITKLRTDVLDAVATAANAARDAKASADAAKSSADAAKSSADSANRAIGDVKSDVAAIKATASDVSGAVSSVYTLVIVAMVFALIAAATSIYILLRLSKALAK